jgi:hypothetical protein
MSSARRRKRRRRLSNPRPRKELLLLLECRRQWFLGLTWEQRRKVDESRCLPTEEMYRILDYYLIRGHCPDEATHGWSVSWAGRRRTVPGREEAPADPKVSGGFLLHEQPDQSEPDDNSDEEQDSNVSCVAIQPESPAPVPVHAAQPSLPSNTKGGGWRQ